MIFFFKHVISFFKKYKIFKTFLALKKYVQISFKNIKFSFIIKQYLAKELKLFCAILIKHYNSNFIKYIIHLYVKGLFKNGYNIFLMFLKRLLKYLYIFYYLKKLQGHCLVLKRYYLITIKICFIKNFFYLFSPNSIFLPARILSFLNFNSSPKDLLLSKKEVERLNYFLIKNKAPKNLFTVLEKKKIKKSFYSRPLNWLTLYTEIQIFFFFERFIFKILSINLIKNKVLVSYLVSLFEKSCLLTLAKKKQSATYFCLRAFKITLLLIKKKKKVIIFEKC